QLTGRCPRWWPAGRAPFPGWAPPSKRSTRPPTSSSGGPRRQAGCVPMPAARTSRHSCAASAAPSPRSAIRGGRSAAPRSSSPGCAPDPGVSRADGSDPEQQALLAEGVGLALLVVLDTLAPAERLAFVLHDMFAVPFEEIAAIVGRSPTTARQVASRARRRVQGANVPDADL